MHQPVLLKEVIEGLRVREGKKYIDATFGLGGHAKEILRSGGVVLGIERDPFLISNVKSKNLKLVCGNFANLKKIAVRRGFGKVSGVLFDLGVSSWQIEKSGRGFSYLRDEPLDMRFNPQEQKISAADILNQATKEELDEIFLKYAEEERSGAIAGALIRARPLKTTGQLRAIIERFGGNIRTKARVFQALRISVNQELENLKKALPQAVELLEKGGRLTVISFHSLEDRIVKREFKVQGSKFEVKIITKKPIRASFREIRENPRARSAKLRIAEKV